MPTSFQLPKFLLQQDNHLLPEIDFSTDSEYFTVSIFFLLCLRCRKGVMAGSCMGELFRIVVSLILNYSFDATINVPPSRSYRALYDVGLFYGTDGCL